MLISKVTESDAGQGEGGTATEGHTHEYQTANQLFELMATNQNFSNDVNTLTTQDLVLLYKNLDLGTKLMTDANEMVTRRSNQYVETVVYPEVESDESELSDVYSNEDLHHMFMVNKERIDLLTTGNSSKPNPLCTKVKELERPRRPSLSEHNQHLLLKDPNLMNQLETFHTTMNTVDIENGAFPTSLLDYICCKRLELNDNSYMENIIRHVQQTIEHLKRISNGDFLTEKAKEKWREVKRINTKARLNNTKILATSTSIPMHIEQKSGDCAPTWEDIMHSAIDIKSLSKILEKRVVLELPNLVSGFRFLAKRSSADSLLMDDDTENLTISCNKNKRYDENSNNKSRLDVIFQLQRSETGQVLSKVSSIMILETKPPEASVEYPSDLVVEEIPQMLSLEYNIDDNKDSKLQEKSIEDEKHDELEEVDKDEDSFDNTEADVVQFVEYAGDTEEVARTEDISNIDSKAYSGNDSLNDEEAQYFNCDDNQCDANIDSGSDIQAYDEYDECDSCQTSLDSKMSGQNEATFCISPIDLRMTIQRLTKEGNALEEENEDYPQATLSKKKSPTRARIKSPYENKSLLIEEKKRKKLLEIRAMREKKKMALAENCKVTKAKYGSGAPVPQPSVTKLSITNKSFYNSIYGRNGNVIMENKQVKDRDHKPTKRDVFEIALEGIEQGCDSASSEKNVKKFIDRSYYLDEAETEVTHVDKDKESTDLFSASNSGVPTDFYANLNLLTHLIGPSESDFTTEEGIPNLNTPSKSDIPTEENEDIQSKVDVCHNRMNVCHNRINVTPSNSPTRNPASDNPDKTTLIDCRKSIDKIYDLLNKLGKSQENNNKLPKSKFTVNSPEKEATTTSSMLPGCDSGTSLKNPISADPSAFSFDKSNNDESKQSSEHKHEIVTIPNPPKVIINSKDKKKERKNPLVKVPENPLRAISQLLREFDNVHKNRQKHNAEIQKPVKKTEKLIEDKQIPKPSVLRRSLRFEQQHDMQDRTNTKSPKERKARIMPEVSKPTAPQSPKVNDFIDEAKEARGEAVRGPSKFYSRLNSLAQPKKSYVQAHSEEYQTRYGRNMMASRLQRLASAPPPPLERPATVTSPNSRSKSKKIGSEAVPSAVKLPTPHVPPLERSSKARPTNYSEVKELETGSSYKQNVPDPLDALISKISARESYVRQPNGRAATAHVFRVESVEKSRVPLVPDDMEIGSSSSAPVSEIEKATELGTRLHHIIDNMLKTKISQHTLEVLPECTDSSLLGKENTENVSSVQNFSKGDKVPTNSEENLGNQFGSNLLMLVTPYESEKNIRDRENKGHKVEASTFKHEKQPFASLTDMEKLQEVSRRLSMGTFHKQLRFKNMMSPKQSMTHVFVLQSGDTASLLVKSTMSHRNVKKPFKNISELSTLPALSNRHVDWNYTQIPMQIATVNYALMPDYKTNMQSSSLVKLFDGSLRNKSPISKRDPNIQSMKATTCKQTKKTQSELILEKRGQGGESYDFSNCILTDTDSADLLNDGNGHSSQMFNGRKPTNASNDSCISAKDKEVTSSLDVLMGLLNEIQNITTGRTNITEDHEANNNLHRKNQGTGSNELISLSSLDRLRQLGSDPSLYSLYLSECDKYNRRNFDVSMVSRLIETTSNDLVGYHTLTDKEVGASDFADKECVDRYTNVPSQVFPLALNYMTNAVQAECSMQSMISCIEYQTPGEKMNNDKLRDWAEIPRRHLSVSELDITGDVVNKIEDFKVNDIKNMEMVVETDGKEKCDKIRIDSQGLIVVSNLDQIKNEELTNVKYDVKTKDYDPMMKMKRDILVTVYSILVLTVFAALSFPEVLYLT